MKLCFAGEKLRLNIIKYFIVSVIFALAFTRESLAVIEFESDDFPQTELYLLTQRLTSEIIKLDIYNVVERTGIDLVMREQKFQHSGSVDYDSAVELGKLTSAENILLGSVFRNEESYVVNARIIQVETGVIVSNAQYGHRGKIESLLTEGIPIIARQLCQQTEGYAAFEQVFLASEASYEKLLRITLKVNSFFGTHIDARNLLKARLLGNYRYYLNIILDGVIKNYHWETIPYFQRELLMQITYLDLATLQGEYESRYDKQF